MTDVTATIFNIQKFSVNDGPGIRTVVFFKGCPLHCLWCANPESQLLRPQLFYDRKKCAHCYHCQSVCQANAISIRNQDIHIDPSICTMCETCIQECPNRALKKEGNKMTVEEVMKVVRQDIDFYEESNGGITLSGGEFLMQPQFARELLKQAKEENIHTACETTAFSSDEAFLSVLPYLDFLFIDCKHWDEEKHKQATGVSNQLILKHMQQAIEAGKEVLVRIPVIPNFNDQLEDALAFARTFQKLGVQKVQLLPFHQFGENKYDLLDLEYHYHDIEAYHPSDLEPYRNVFIENHIEAFF